MIDTINDKTYEEKVERFDTAMRGGIPDRVPVFGTIMSWIYYYCGYTENDIIRDPMLNLECYLKVCRDFYFDMIFTITPPPVVTYKNLLGGGAFQSAGDTVQFDTTKIQCMEADEYKLLSKDFNGFMEKVILPRKFALFAEDYSEDKYNKLIKAQEEYNRLFGSLGSIIEKFTQESAMPNFIYPAGYWHPFDVIMDYLRNFDIMSDIRRRPDEVLEACDVILKFIYEAAGIEKRKPMKAKAFQIPMHAPIYLKPKDFERFYFPYLLNMIDFASQKGFMVECFFEGDYSHLYDYLQEIPKYKVVGMFEKDDIRLVKKKLGNTMGIIGGMNTYTLKHGKKQECLDMAKALIDDLAPGGGWIFCQDKMLSCCGEEVNADNFKAVTEFVHEYGVYK